MQDAAAPPIRNRITLAEGRDPAGTYLVVNNKRVSVAAFLASDLAAATWVNASDCTGLTSLDLPAAITVDARGCTGASDVICAGADSRGYDFVGIKLRGAWGIFAGCRHNFDFDKSRLHWRNNPECLALVEKIVAEAAHRDVAAAQQEAA
jgi:hypothetical protein